jgi:hypothetical protein
LRDDLVDPERGRQHYFMFPRRIGHWSTAEEVKQDFESRRAYI